MKAIETRYKGYRFRSRLEARWAVLFDALGVKWEYEKEGYDLGAAGRYLPDFWIPEKDCFVEVKGSLISLDDDRKIRALRENSGKRVFLAGEIPNTGEEGPPADPYFPRLMEREVSPAPNPPVTFFDGHDTDRAWGTGVRCPVCRFEYVHFGHPEQIDGKDDYKAWGGRGNAIRISMNCENGHSWIFRMGFHKGHTFVGLENVMETISGLCLWMANGNQSRCDAAYEAARSARFEHGEMPRV